MCKDNKGSGGQADSGADPASLVALRAEEARLAAEVQAMALQVAAKRVSWKCFARRFDLFMELLVFQALLARLRQERGPR